MNARIRASLPSLPGSPARSLRADETGATTVEYGLIAALIVLAILSGLKGLGVDMASLPLQSIINALNSVL